MRKAVIPVLVIVVIIAALVISFFSASTTPRTVEVTLEVYEKTIEVAPGKYVNMWTYNGTVPGPTIRARVGDTVRIRLINRHNLAHSVHMHTFRYKFEDDGADPVARVAGLSSVVPPGKVYVYEFKPKRAGLFYYHCHSDDKYPISVHMQQGLYGAIIIEPISSSTGAPPDKEYVVFFGEVYSEPIISMLHSCAYCYTGIADKLFTINARVFPLTESFKAKRGELVRFYAINIGNDIHTWHLHGMEQFVLREIGGKRQPELIESQVLSLAPGVAAIIETTADEPGTWLLHCHVVPHADMGMDALFHVAS